jgi:prepilin-type N-terminal cleavage/methylation domain-containing protein
MSRTTESRKGFTLVELAVVIVIIGVLAAFGVPQFLKSVERSKASEAFNYLSAVRSAQERYLAKNGIYWGGTIDAAGSMSSATSGAETLDINQTPPKYFTGAADGTTTDVTITMTADSSVAKAPTWCCTLTRIADTSSYGPYSVAYDQMGYIPPGQGTSSTPARTTAGSTIVADINPMGQ